MLLSAVAEASSRRRRRLVGAVVLAWLLVGGSAGSTASEPLGRHPAGTGQRTLSVIVTGGAGDGGTVHVSAGADCTTAKFRDAGSAEPCRYEVGEGQPVTLTPEGAGFVGWSVYECPGTNPCTLTMDSDRTVVATFTPTRLTVKVNSPDSTVGTVTAKVGSDVKITCPSNEQTSCQNDDLGAFDQVTLTAVPGDKFERWLGACREAGTNPECTLFLSGDDIVGARFAGDPDDFNEQNVIIPPRQKALLRVVVDPAGAGKVTSTISRSGEKIDCNPTCNANFEQGESPTLTAQDGPGTFVEWRAPNLDRYCKSSDRTCHYPAFLATSIQAVFRTQTQPPPPPPQPPSPQPPQPQPPQPAAACSQQRMGTARGDRLDGTAGGDTLLGKAGNDLIRGLAGDDCLSGGGGDDTIKGGKGNDKVSGGAGADVLFGGPGRDRLNGGPGPDRIVAKDGASDTIACGPGRDLVASSDAVDKISGCERVRR
jgi:hypothetical protein